MILRTALEKIFRLREKANRAAPGSDGEASRDPHEKPFLDHLEDLRMMFMRMIVTQIVVTILAFIFNAQLFDLTFEPVRSQRAMVEIEKVDEAGNPVLDEAGKPVVEKVTLEEKIKLTTFSPAEAFMLSLKVAFIAGFMLAFPLHAYFLAQFILPGLTEKEKKVLIPAIGIGFILFLIGASFAFIFALPYALKFLFAYGLSLDLESTWRVGYYISFVTQVTLAFGICWELPLVVTILVKLRLLTYRAMKGSRSIAIMVICVASAVFTPPDPVTMVFMMVPLVVLYEICIWISYFLNRKQDAIEAAEEVEYQEWVKKTQEEEARLAEERREAALTAGANDTDNDSETGATDPAALKDEWDDDYYHDDPHHDWHKDSSLEFDDHYSEDLHEVECPEDRANIARRRKIKALMKAAEEKAGQLVNVNMATKEQLLALPGIEDIVAENIANGGPYLKVEDLLEVEGMTQEILATIEPRIFAG